MILQVNREETAALTLHMSIMRASFRNLLKKQYKANKDKLLVAYDYVHKTAIELLESDLERSEMHLNINDLEVLEAFLKAYTAKLEGVLKEAKLNVEDEEQLEILQRIQKKCEDLAAA